MLISQARLPTGQSRQPGAQDSEGSQKPQFIAHKLILVI